MLQKLQSISEDFCGLDVNTPLGGEAPIQMEAALAFNDLLTAVAATSTGDYTVVFLGTGNGHLKKVSLTNRNFNTLEENCTVKVTGVKCRVFCS